MLSLPQSGDREVYDGLPVVQLSTSSADLANFLSFFYDPRHALLAKDERDVAHKLLGALALADMLLIEPITKAIFDRIRDDWEINSIQHWRTKVKSFAKALDPDEECKKHLYVEPASVLHAARRFDDNGTAITPTLIFELAFRDPYIPYHGLEVHTMGSSSSPTPALGARWDLVSATDKAKAGNFREEFLSIIGARLSRLRSECTTKYHRDQADCTRYFKEEVDGIFTALLGGCHPFLLLEAYKLHGMQTYARLNVFADDVDIFENAICIPCGRSWDEKLEKLQSDLFVKIPEVFQKIW